MKQLHEELKEIRMEKGISLKTISEKTKIRLDFLERIEEGDYTVTPKPFVRAFLREYADVIEIDPQLVMSKLDNKIATILPEKPSGHHREESIRSDPEDTAVFIKTSSDKSDQENRKNKYSSTGNEVDELLITLDNHTVESVDDTSEPDKESSDTNDEQTTLFGKPEEKPKRQRRKRKTNTASSKKNKTDR